MMLLKISSKKQNKTFPLQKRMMVTMTEIWLLQPRFEKLKKNRVIRLFSHPRFRAAYDFMLLRSSQSEVNNEVSNWWIKFVETSDEDRKVILNKLS
jgi:poly(A) polymerase